MVSEPKKVLSELGLTDAEIAVYLAMVRGTHSVRDIMKTTRQKRPTVYYAISKLLERGLVRQTGLGPRERWQPEPPERLKTIAAQKIKEMRSLEEAVNALVPGLSAKTEALEKRPHVAFYEGVEAVKNVIMETLYCRERHIDSIAPKENFFWHVGDDFALGYVAERARRRIKTRNLWEAPIDVKRQRKEHYEGLSEIRILPAVMHGKFVTTIFLYDDKTLYISSLKNAYALLVTSQEHHDAMRALFDGLWAGSQKGSQKG